MSIKKSTLGGLMIVDNDGDRVTFEPEPGEADNLYIKAGNLVMTERSDIAELVRYLTGWLEETSVPDGWYVVRHEFHPGPVAARVYDNVLYGTMGKKLYRAAHTIGRRIGDLTPEEIATLDREDM